MPTKEQMEILLCKIDNEGFDYCFTVYSDWQEFNDTSLQIPIANYRNASESLKSEINNMAEVLCADE